MPKPTNNKHVNEILTQASEAIERGMDITASPETRTSYAALASACATTILALTTAAAAFDE